MTVTTTKDEQNLVERIRVYASFLDGKLREEKDCAEGESLQGSIVADQRWSAYRSAQQELYKLFPELERK